MSRILIAIIAVLFVAALVGWLKYDIERGSMRRRYQGAAHYPGRAWPLGDGRGFSRGKAGLDLPDGLGNNPL